MFDCTILSNSYLLHFFFIYVKKFNLKWVIKYYNPTSQITGAQLEGMKSMNKWPSQPRRLSGKKELHRCVDNQNIQNTYKHLLCAKAILMHGTRWDINYSLIQYRHSVLE